MKLEKDNLEDLAQVIKVWKEEREVSHSIPGKSRIVM